MANNQETKPRVAIVTGGARGIGRSCIERLAGDGFSIVVNYASNDTEANAAVASVVDQGGKAMAQSYF